VIKIKWLILFTITTCFLTQKARAEDVSVPDFDQSCHEFKELMVSGNKLMFLRSNLTPTEASWRAVLCLHCSQDRESKLLKVISTKDGSIDWRYKEKDFLAIDEILGNEDDLNKEKLGMHSILGQVRKTCRSYLDPVNEGSHLQLTGNESCVRHEYFRLYLKRKYELSEYSYAELESKKDLAEKEFLSGCHQILQATREKNVFTKTMASVFVGIKRLLGLGLGEYDPVVSRDSKSFQREIATEVTAPKLK
jgi:hypothetical protein